MKRVYIAGKITGLPQEFVQKKFKEAQETLTKLGFIVYNPVNLVNDFSTPWNIAMKICISTLIDCDAMVLLPCWQNSKGAKIERQLAEDLDILICNYSEFGLKVLKSKLA